jgi:hypothetical protein
LRGDVVEECYAFILPEQKRNHQITKRKFLAGMNVVPFTETIDNGKTGILVY